MRKSFIIHNDSLDILDDLTDEQCGELFRAIRSYQFLEEINLSPIVKIAFSPFRNQFARDSEKYEKLCEKNRLIAVNRHKRNVTKSTSGNQSLPSVTKSTDSDSDSDSDSDNKNMGLAKWIYQGVLTIAPKTKKPNFEKWADDIRLMINIDKHTHHEIAKVFKWANKDQFWKTNILSPAKLRQKYSQLHAKMNANKPDVERQSPVKMLTDTSWADHLLLQNSEDE